jgi:hypothetical protein
MIGPGGTICAKGLKYKTTDKTYVNKRRLKRTADISVTFESSVDGNTQIPTELALGADMHVARDISQIARLSLLGLIKHPTRLIESYESFFTTDKVR